MDKRLLLADDETDIREILTLYLADMGYEVLGAEDGDRALEVFRRNTPPFVVADIKMPGRDGISLLKEIKILSPDTEVILITGHGDLDLAIKSLKYGAADFITKPINHDILEASLDRVYEKASMRAQIRRHREDIHRLVQEELRSARHKYHQLFEAVPNYITVQDRSFRITEQNRLFTEHFGDGLGRFCYASYKHRENVCPDCPVSRTFETGERHHAETVVKTNFGKSLNVWITTAPIQDAAGRVTHVMEVLTDITEIRALQDQLTSLGLLIGSVSHGLKGLLTGMDGGLYLIKSGLSKQKADQVAEGYEIVGQMARRIKKQVMDILYYAKNRELDVEPLDAAAFAVDVARTVAPRIAERPIELVTDFPSEPVAFEADAGVLSAALVNILENAVDACGMDTRKPFHRVRFAVGSDSDSVYFDIEDTGVGFDAETRDRMFTLFFSSKGAKGTGLGLFISHQMISRHGGIISVASQPGEGAHFHIRIPRRQQMRAEKSADKSEKAV